MVRRETDLDVVRGLAILLAMGWHFNKVTGSPIADAFLWPGHTFGWAGVDLFFVLSGFLVGRLVLREIQTSGTMDRLRFFERRAFKLWPTLYVFLVLFLVWSPWRAFFFQIGLHVQNFVRTPVATHLWSLAVEEHFYLIFAFLAPLYFAKPRTGRGFSFIMVGIMAAALALRCAAFAAGVPADTLQVQTQYRIDALACGVGLASIAVFSPDAFAALLGRRAVWLAGICAGVAFLSCFPKSSPIGCTLGFTVAYLTSACVLLAIYRSGVELVAPRLCRPIAAAGVYSYAIYIWHVPAEKLLDRFVLAGHVASPVAVVTLNYAAAIVTGYAMSRALEQPFLALRARIFHRPAHGRI